MLDGDVPVAQCGFPVGWGRSWGSWWEIKGASRAAAWVSTQLGDVERGPHPRLQQCSEEPLVLPQNVNWKRCHLVPNPLGRSKHPTQSKISQTRQEGNHLPRSMDHSTCI